MAQLHEQSQGLSKRRKTAQRLSQRP